MGRENKDQSMKDGFTWRNGGRVECDGMLKPSAVNPPLQAFVPRNPQCALDGECMFWNVIYYSHLLCYPFLLHTHTHIPTLSPTHTHTNTPPTKTPTHTHPEQWLAMLYSNRHLYVNLAACHSYSISYLIKNTETRMGKVCVDQKECFSSLKTNPFCDGRYR